MCTKVWYLGNKSPIEGFEAKLSSQTRKPLRAWASFQNRCLMNDGALSHAVLEVSRLVFSS